MSQNGARIDPKNKLKIDPQHRPEIYEHCYAFGTAYTPLRHAIFTTLTHEINVFALRILSKFMKKPVDNDMRNSIDFMTVFGTKIQSFLPKNVKPAYDGMNILI